MAMRPSVLELPKFDTSTGAYEFETIKSELLDELNFTSDPKLKEVLLSICSELFYIVNLLTTERNYVHAFASMILVSRTLKETLKNRGPEIRQSIRQIKEHKFCINQLGVEARQFGQELKLQRILPTSENSFDIESKHRELEIQSQIVLPMDLSLMSRYAYTDL